MPLFALFTVVETDEFKKTQNKECSRMSRGRRVKPSRKRQENDDIAEEAVSQKGCMEEAAMARALRKKVMDTPERPNLEL